MVFKKRFSATVVEVMVVDRDRGSLSLVARGDPFLYGSWWSADGVV